MHGTALVLGGGGPVGAAWMAGVLAGLTDEGIDLRRADVVIGTSAGAIYGSRLTGGQPPREMYERQLAGEDRIDLDVTTAQTLRFLWAALGSRDPERSVRRLGRAALTARTAPASEMFDAVRAILRGATDWPARALRIAAVDAVTGEVATFDADAKVDLVDAVAASCAVPLVWPPVALDGARWIDGGCRSTANLNSPAATGRWWPSPRSRARSDHTRAPSNRPPTSPPRAPRCPSCAPTARAAAPWAAT